jgi:hypothetical protein
MDSLMVSEEYWLLSRFSSDCLIWLFSFIPRKRSTLE